MTRSRECRHVVHTACVLTERSLHRLTARKLAALAATKQSSSRVDDATIVIPLHGRSRPTELSEYGISSRLDCDPEGVKGVRNLDEVLASRPTAEFDAYGRVHSPSGCGDPLSRLTRQAGAQAYSKLFLRERSSGSSSRCSSRL